MASRISIDPSQYLMRGEDVQVKGSSITPHFLAPIFPTSVSRRFIVGDTLPIIPCSENRRIHSGIGRFCGMGPRNLRLHLTLRRFWEKKLSESVPGVLRLSAKQVLRRGEVRPVKLISSVPSGVGLHGVMIARPPCQSDWTFPAKLFCCSR